MKIGRKIYYELITGNVILATSEMQGSVIPTTIDQDFFNYAELKERTKETVGVIKLEYGEYAQDFATCSGFTVNKDSKELVFTYPTNPGEPPVTPSKPLSEQVTDLKTENSSLKQQLTQTNQDLIDFIEYFTSTLA
jgi:hypothetical protein